MKCRVGVNLVFAAGLAIASSTAASAAKLPEIKSSASNAVPACVTPGRLMAYLEDRNSRMARKFKKVAVEYMRHGEALGIRWDIAFFQMLVETNSLKFGRDVSASQNNFAGLGATGGGVPGERFDSVSDGVKAHLQHILMYAGEHIDDPVAERTRKVQAWGILDRWRNRIGRPLTYTDLTRQWSPGDSGYSNDIKTIADRFTQNYCNKRDPHPEWIAEARGGGAKRQDLAQNTAEDTPRIRNYAQEAIERGKRNGDDARTGLGASKMAAGAGTLPYTVLNKQKNDAAPLQPAAAGGAGMLPKDAGPFGRNGKKLKCNVFTASYGGQKAVIIKAIANNEVNYTVLDINAGKERAETQAYIEAYAKGGKAVANFTSQAQALDKAFELCPEG